MHLVHTAILENKDPRREVFKMVMMHNTTPHDTIKVAPAEAMMNRHVKAFLPVKKKPLNSMQKLIVRNTESRKETNKVYHE